jgi:hypothetical protein
LQRGDGDEENRILYDSKAGNRLSQETEVGGVGWTDRDDDEHGLMFAGFGVDNISNEANY